MLRGNSLQNNVSTEVIHFSIIAINCTAEILYYCFYSADYGNAKLMS